MAININDVIENHGLTLSTSTLVKLIVLYDKMMGKCFYNGTPEYIHPTKCKFCKEYQVKMNTENVVCRKHYAVKKHNDPSTNISDLIYRGEVFKLFGRYALKTTPACTYVFYITPLHIDGERFCIYVYPPEVFRDRKSKYIWTSFKKSTLATFNLENSRYMLDTTDKYHITIKEI